MGRKIPSEIGVNVFRAYLRGLTRDEIAEEYSISKGSASNILDPLRKLIGPEGEALRNLLIQLIKLDITVAKSITNANASIKKADIRQADDAQCHASR